MIIRVSGYQKIRLQDIWISGCQTEGKIEGTRGEGGVQ